MTVSDRLFAGEPRESGVAGQVTLWPGAGMG